LTTGRLEAEMETLSDIMTPNQKPRHLQSQVMLSEFAVEILWSQISIRIQGIITDIFFDLRSDLLKLKRKPSLLGESARGELAGYGVEKVLFNKLLNDLSLLIQYSVDSEIEVSAVKLKELFQEILKLVARRCDRLRSNEYGHGNALLSVPVGTGTGGQCQL
jgi:hypothetical protein